MRENHVVPAWSTSARVGVRDDLYGPHRIVLRDLSVDSDEAGPPWTEREDRIGRVTLEQLSALVQSRTPTRYERFVKPVIDRAVAALLLLLLSPVLLMVSLAVLVTMGRPVLLGQMRAGRNGSPFAMKKFRTMLPDRRVKAVSYVGPDRRVTHKSAADPRHTRLGRWLRRMSLDELPQLFNVLRGEMSLVGPRPELMDLTAHYEPWQHCRHVVKPGVTGLWQTTERGEGRPLHECTDLDLIYIDGLSFRRDIAILGRTPLCLLRNKGVI